MVEIVQVYVELLPWTDSMYLGTKTNHKLKTDNNYTIPKGF